jgi:hypothetical protein
MTKTPFLREFIYSRYNRYNRLASTFTNVWQVFKNFDFGGKIRKIGGILKTPFQLPPPKSTTLTV